MITWRCLSTSIILLLKYVTFLLVHHSVRSAPQSSALLFAEGSLTINNKEQ
jgi:hypothetical protein